MEAPPFHSNSAWLSETFPVGNGRRFRIHFNPWSSVGPLSISSIDVTQIYAEESHLFQLSHQRGSFSFPLLSCISTTINFHFQCIINRDFPSDHHRLIKNESSEKITSSS